MIKRHLYIIFIILSAPVDGQSDYFSNPSFEGESGKQKLPDGWFACNAKSTPDIQPVDVTLEPTNGQTYIGLVMRSLSDPEPKNEDIVTELLKPLYRDSTYILSVDLAYAPYLRELDILYNNVPQLRIWGGNSKCVMNQVFAISKPIDHSEWIRYCFLITPKTNTTYLSFEIFAGELQSAYMVLDNLSLESFSIQGRSHVCTGSQNEIYTIPAFNCASKISVSYTGSGATYSHNGNSITMNFNNDATSGDLIVQFMNSDTKSDNLVFPITVDENLPVSGIISGATNVCQGQSLEYYETNAANTAIYNWSYKGSGADINVQGKGITVNFSNTATSGTLTLIPENGCGVGKQMTHYIALVPLPSDPGLISGEDMVCQGQTAMYHVNGITYASDYIWNYTGSGATLNNGSLDLEISFSEDATGGYLTVSGINECGEGKKSLEYIIFMNEIPENAGLIEGQPEICPDQSEVIYKTNPIRNAVEYVWNYSGEGVFIKGNSSQAELSISDGFTGGVLSVSGRNLCGTGNPSPEYYIKAGALPSVTGDIGGNTQLCSEEGGRFFVLPVDGATSYVWNYDGHGAEINSVDNSAKISFADQESAGNLTVYAVNQCGIGEPSPPLAIHSVPCNFFIPNAFTPNNDGVNDMFVIRDLNNNAELIIFDRSGKIVYENTDYQNNWDGRDINGNLLPTDTYWYVLIPKGLDREMKGYVYLKR